MLAAQSNDSLAIVGVIVGAAFLGGLAKGITAMGLGLIAIPLIALLLDVQTAVLSVFLSKVISDVALLFDSRTDAVWRSSLRLGPFVIAGALAIPVGTYLLAKLEGTWLYFFLGASILAFVVYQLHPRPMTISPRGETRWGTVFGAATGATQGLAGVGGPYMAMYLYSLRISPAEFVFLSSVINILLDVGQLVAVLYLGMYDRARLFYAILTVVPVMAGASIGIRLRARLNPRTFKRFILVVLTLSGASLLARGVHAWM